jgi:hypothetical protein
VNLLEEEETALRYESDDTASTASNTAASQLATPAPSRLATPHSSFSAADRTQPPLDLARLLDPFEQLEREWEAGPATIRPPSAFCSLTDIQEEERVREVEEVEVGSGEGRVITVGRSEGREGEVRLESELDDSGVHSDLPEEEEPPKSRYRPTESWIFLSMWSRLRPPRTG